MKTHSMHWAETRYLAAACRAGLLLLCLAAAATTHAQTLTTLYNFCPTEPYCGTNPNGGLVAATDGNFYGTAQTLAYEGAGTVFQIIPAGESTTFNTLYSFGGGTDGGGPMAGLVQATNGNFYGTTAGCCGGPTADGTVFEITSAGVLTTLHSFDGTDGTTPFGGLMQGSNGNFYGTTLAGGKYGYGTVFKISTLGVFTTLHSFNGTDGKNPIGTLVQGNNGNLYGTTNEGGTIGQGYGTVFEITTAGKLTTLHSFDGTDGNGPYGGLVLATDGNFYGTTEGGGANGGYGTVFQITPAGALTVLYSFCSLSGCTDGYDPQGALVQATDGNFYGTTVAGGTSGNYGTVFEITLAGALTTLHSFDFSDGSVPQDGLVQATDGNFYGTTLSGGLDSGGTAFRLSTGLSPFVELLQTSGTIGTTVDIVGTNLAGTSSVSFNTTAAKFTLLSATEIKTSVPNGATTGFVSVTTPNGTLNSNKIFSVIQATLTPISATYAAQTVGTTSSAKTFTLTNDETVALTSIVISTTGDFAESSTTCTTSLAAKSKCTIGVTFTPTQTGTRVGELSVSDSASNSPQISNLTGTGK